MEGVWRDFYSGDLLDNYTKPWISANKDNGEGNTFNCIELYIGSNVVASWEEWQCYQPEMGCPCKYETLPILQLRGFCPNINIEDEHYIPLQLEDDSNNIIMIGSESAQIRFNSSQNKWILHAKRSNVTAVADTSQLSFALVEDKPYKGNT